MKNIFTFLLFIVFFFTVRSQTCDGRYQTQIFNNVDVTTVDYGAAVNMAGDTQILQMDIYQAQGDTATDRPIVILCFGGSFVAGSRTSSELVTFAKSFAKRGYVAASIDYRLAASYFDLISEENMIKVVFGAVQDGKASIRYFRKNFDEGNSLGIDPNQIFIGGTSAGGILAMNLAYVDSFHKLPANWQEWANEIGGIEGNSGNPGYCSYVSGVFGFSGAVGDTSYIDANDVPYYGIHAEDDETVLYGYGAPLQGYAPVNLYGSSLVYERLSNLGVYTSFDSYTGADHPPLNGTNMATTTANLSAFFYNILDCNPNNLKKSFQQDCDDFYIEQTDTVSTAIKNTANRNSWSLYPNPSSNLVNIEGVLDFESIKIYDIYGKLVFFQLINNINLYQIDISNFAKGFYTIQLGNQTEIESEILIVK